ncbi:SP_1767 family glycosyltransferase [Empedobacter falsenii]
MNTTKTIDHLINNKVSVARFGDGEFDLVLNNRSLAFQENNNLLRKKLIEILKTTEQNIYVCIPYSLISTSNMNKKSNFFWNLYKNRNYQNLIPYFNFKTIYGDSLFTRLYMDYEDKSNSSQLFNKLFEVWKSKNILIIEGSESKLGVGNDIFENVKSIKRILCPSTNAFKNYNEILEKIIEFAEKENLILISLGPTATVLAFDLAKLGYWAIDIGHIDIEYEWMKVGAVDKINLENRKVWEVNNVTNMNVSIDESYKKSIIYEIYPS